MRHLLTLLLLLAAPAWATVPSGFTETDYLSNDLTNATGLAWAPDGSGRLFITRKEGQIRVVTMKDGVLETSGSPPRLVTKLFATEPNIYKESECGLVGIAFDPNYVANRYVYVFVTVSATEQQIVRYTDVDTTGISRTVIVSGLPTRGQNHDGGGIGFGPDGKLYWSIGDLGNGTGVDADLTSLAAKVSRANRDGTPANDNPFNDGVGPNNEYIWARGFRNPFTLTFQPSTGLLWVNVVGTGYEQTFVVRRRNHAGYDDYENNQPATNDYITPVIKYRTNGADTRNLTTAARTGGVTTLTTGTQRHGFRKGEKLTISGVADATFNGDFYVASVPSDTTVTVAQAGQPDATSTGGTARTQELGGCMNGGVFYDSTLFPAEFRGNYFFGDYNSANFMRVALAEDNTVATVDLWGSNFASFVDVAVGPDGALYTIGVTGGRLRRIAPASTGGQKLVVTNLFPRVVEGGRAIFTVSLAQAPTEPVVVDVYRAPGGSTDLRLSGPTAFTFTASDWSTPRVVTIEALEDADADPDTATFVVGANGLSSESVVATTIDDNQVQLVLTSGSVTVPEGGTATFDVSLSRAPASAVTYTVARASGDADITVQSGASLTFDATNWDVPQRVTLAAAQDADNVDGVATISLSAPRLDARTVTATEADDEPLAPVITSSAPTSGVVGSPYRYDVEVRARPAATFSLTASPPGMSIDAASGLITWTPTTPMSSTVTVVAANGISPDASQTFTLAVKQDEPPRASLTRPRPEERVSGDSAEFYGDCFDDVGCTRAEFFIDGVLEYAEDRTDNHFHFGGEHNRWDTTGLAPGGHLVKLVVVDTGGARHEAEVKVCVGTGSCELVPPPAPDAGTSDGGTSDAGTSDGGTLEPRPVLEGDSGCGCGAAPVGSLAWVALTLLAVSRRRRARD